MFGDIGGSEVILIMVVILIFFGANKIPELARGLGKGIREFKDASTEIRREFEQAGQPAQPNNYAQQNNNYPPQQQYGAQNQYPAPLPVADAEPASGFDPWATPAYVAPTTAAAATAAADEAFTHKTEEPAPPVASQLPPNLAPEGTQPRQPYIPANASPSADA
ncbi:Sec-independent protein translocase subunit TatA/TatB [Hymenobacter properus]|uniref:Sec-independent protein translocase protein TatA n=1 Tax=Hymenobacter properus TaxID=2791026 RepID=A0A931FKK4_9BACT|nr:twin-arginine translocase TatA/TatE family subunit [Hymenobacter properus]MBF9143158.1 twin-arginine translocase TatA/TatE family subunit [Hymenobacter properus]MBR7721966.1 twin-arginine translocase TatA/TatE family subunit [Microvirga sp. SRT04]